jgi:hypothetical protein
LIVLRSAALAVAVCLFVVATAAAAFDHGAWPFVFWTALVALALAFERRRYGAAQSGRLGPGWQQTGERFFDDATGQQVEVWFDPSTGERRYVKAD